LPSDNPAIRPVPKFDGNDRGYVVWLAEPG
jgi:hypothetical protein